MPLGKHAKIGVGWAAICCSGVFLFYLSKTSIEKRRYENMKIRQRIRESNSGDYDASYRKFS